MTLPSEETITLVLMEDLYEDTSALGKIKGNQVRKSEEVQGEVDSLVVEYYVGLPDGIMR